MVTTPLSVFTNKLISYSAFNIQFICVCIEPGQLMTWAGTSEPTAIVQLTNLGQHDAEKTKKYTETLTEHLVKMLGVPQDRYVTLLSHLALFAGLRGTNYYYKHAHT